jgi:hypothetical protein
MDERKKIVQDSGSTIPVLPDKKYVKFTKCKNTRQLSVLLDPSCPSIMVNPGKWKVEIAKTNQGLTKVLFNVNLFKNEYLDWFWYQLKSSWLEHAFILFTLFPNVKEQTESVCMLHFAETFQDLSNSLIFVIGDGVCPRTGALFALRYPDARVYSIDPLIKDNKTFDNLHCITSLVEDFIKTKEAHDLLSKCSKLCIVSPHSHANIYQCLSRLNRYKIQKCIVSMPCCQPKIQILTEAQEYELGLNRIHHCYDFNVHSEKNEVYVWITPKDEILELQQN